MWENNKYVDWFKENFPKPIDWKYNNINDAAHTGGAVIDNHKSLVKEPNPDDMGGAGVLAPEDNSNVGPFAPNQEPANTQKDKDSYFPGGSVTDFDMDDPESVKALQIKLGVTADGMFGPQTEKAYRMAVDAERQHAGQDSLKYDYNDQVQSEKKFQPFGGMLRKAYSKFDEKHMGGKLPGGYKDSDVMTAEEFYNK